MDERCDALVIGGGPAGATAALLLARAGWSVTLLERKAFPRRKVCGEYLSATNWPLFEDLGIAEAFNERAGPDVTHVGLFAGNAIVTADLPLPERGRGYGRALGREHLDQLLIKRAAAAGARLLQPWSAKSLEREGDRYRCNASGEGRELVIRSRIVIAAHGFWEPGPLPTQPERIPGRAGDLLGFKAHFLDSGLAGGLMPLLAFPGGYGGMVRCDGGRVSLSCCVRRSRLDTLRRCDPEKQAGEVVFAHILESCRGVREALASAKREGEWLSAGPLRPGIRRAADGCVFRVGNAAGEAHPVVAEGISMAMQSAWLLTRRLTASGLRIDWQGQGGSRLGSDYSLAWRASFAPRLRAASAIAYWAMRPAVVGVTVPLLRRCPAVLAWGARLSGKATRVVTWAE
jgi:flavin-dependent dehydrogenase